MNEQGAALAQRIRNAPYSRVELLGFVDSRETSRLGAMGKNKLLGKLDELRATLETTCNERIATEAQSRFDAWLLAEAAKPSKPGVSKPKPVTSKPKGKPSVDPLPQPTTPPVSDPKKDKMDQQKNDPSNTGGKKDKMEQQKTDPSNTNSKKDKMKQQSGNQ
jgi:hypothetical protein